MRHLPNFVWTPAYEGVELAAASVQSQVQQDVNVAKIDLRTPGLQLFTTPHAGPYHTLGDVCTGFLDAYPEVMLAINANFSCFIEHEDEVNKPFSLFGAAISCGKIVCDPSRPAPQPDVPIAVMPDVPDSKYAGPVALLVTRDNQAAIRTVTAADPCDLSRYWTAVAGGINPVGPGWPPHLIGVPDQQLVVEGNINAPSSTFIAARTGIGLSEDGNLLYLLTIDGIEGEPYGADFHDLGEWLVHAGVHNGFALDGGGSTVMARREPPGKPFLVNQPHGNETWEIVQRPVGNFLGVISRPLLPHRVG